MSGTQLPVVVNVSTRHDESRESPHTSDEKEVHPGSSSKLRIGLRMSIALVTVFMVLFSSAAVHFPWYLTATSNTKDMVAQLNQEIISGIIGEVVDMQIQTESVQQTIIELLRDGVVDTGNPEAINNLFLPMLKNQPHFSWISFGQPNGNFSGAHRIDNKNFSKVFSTWNEETQVADRSFQYFVEQNNALFKIREETKTSNYDARERPWYKLAFAEPSAETGPKWTDVYVFSTNKQLGINTAIRFERNKAFLGVISIAIELERLSAFLSQKFKDKPGTAFIINPDTSLVAYVDSNDVSITNDMGEESGLRMLSKSQNPLLNVASMALKNTNTSLSDIKDTIQFDLTLEDGSVYFVNFAPIGRLDWIVGTVVPQEAFYEAIRKNNKKLTIIVLITMSLVILFSILISRRIFIKPLTHIIAQTKSVQNFALQDVRHVRSVITELDDLSQAFNQMAGGLRSFQKYLPADLVQVLVKNGQLAQVGGVNRTMTIFFSDLEGFTSISEILGPGLVPHLSEYLHDMSEEIHECSGTIDKFIGDAIMAFWGAPILNDNHAVDGCRAALRCYERLKAQQDYRAANGLPVFKARIGLNTGRVIVGNIGSEMRMDYTVLGDPVNLAARLEALNKTYGTRILIGATTHEFAKYDVITRKIDTVNVKGKNEKTAVYELLAMRPGPGVDVPGYEWIAHYEKGLSMMDIHQYQEAIQCFKQTIELRGGEDSPSEFMINRCIQSSTTAIT